MNGKYAMNGKRVAVSVATCVALSLSAIARDDIFWDKTKAYGVFDDPNMWDQPELFLTAGADRLLRMESSNAGTGVTNTVRLVDYNLRGALNLYMWTTSSLVLDGSDVWFRQRPTTAGELVNNTGTFNAFLVRDNDYSLPAFAFEAEDLAYDATISFSNAVQRFDRTMSPHAMKWTIESGSVSFAEPDGANAKHKMTLDCNGTDKVEGMTTVEIGKDADVVFPKLVNACYSTNSAFVVNGGKVTVLGDHDFDKTASAAGWRGFVGTHDLVVTNGGRFCQLGGATTIGLNGNQGKRFDRFTVTGAGSSYTVGTACGAWSALLSAELNVLDGGSFAFEPNKAFQLGVAYSNTGTDELKLRVAGAGSTFDAVNAESLTANRHATLLFEDGATVTLPRTVYLSLGGANDDVTMTIRGADTKVLLGGADQCYFYPGFSAGKATVNMEGGYLSAVDGKDFCLRPAANADGTAEFNLSGGTLEIKYAIGYSSFHIAFRGNGLFHMSGGELKNERAMNFNYETTSTSERTSRFYMTGGLATVAEGVKMSNIDSAYRRSIVDLDGGTLVTSMISADNSVTAGKLAPADFTADGGTIVPNAATTSAAPFIQNIDTFKLGVQGLTVDTKAYATYIRQAMTNKAETSGLFVKKGSATLQIAGAPYRVARTRVDEGTLYLPDARPDFTTALSVGPGAVFSIEGAPADVTLTGLAVTNGTLRLDPTDVITVHGPVAIQKLHLSFTSLPTLETAANFLVVDGQLAPADARALRCAVMDAMEIQEGAHVEVLTTYDEQTGKTTVSLKYATDAEPFGDADTVTWNGNGADWSTVANWNGGLPTAAKKASFPETAAKTVNVAAAVKAGAVAFAADGYTLTGAGSIEIAGEQGAAEIASTAGAATVDMPVLLDTVTALPVAEGASLTFEKPVLNGGIKKTGAGRLVLAGSNEFERTVSVAGGLNLVKNAQGLGVSTVGSGRAAFERGTLRFASDDAAAAFDTGLGFDIVGGTTNVTDPAILDVRTPTSVKNVMAAGSFFKRGAEKLTLDLRGEVGAANVLTTYRSGAASSEGKPPQITPVTFDEVGAPSLADLGGFTVFEGAVEVKGDANSPTVTVPGSGVVGYPVSGGVEADPVLDISGARVEQTTHASKWALHFYLGYGLGQSGTGNVNPTLRVKDGSAFICNTLRVGKSTYGVTACQPTVEVTDSTLISSYILRLSEIETVKSVAKWRCRNAQIGITSSYFAINGNVDAEFFNTYVGRMFADGHARLDPVDTNALAVDGNTTGRVVFAENSQFCCRTFDNFANLKKQLEFVFDDSEWMWKGTGQENFSLPASLYTTEKFKIVMRGKGLFVRPAAGYTFTTAVPFWGAGGFQNLGAGTVAFGANTLQFTGTCYTKAGATTDLSAAGTVTDATFGGAGTVTGGTFGGRTSVALVAADDWTADEVPTFANCSLAGTTITVDYGRTEADPLSETLPTNLLVAKFSNCTGTPTFKLKSKSTGLKSVAGKFTVDPTTGEVRMSVYKSGLMMIVR